MELLVEVAAWIVLGGLGLGLLAWLVWWWNSRLTLILAVLYSVTQLLARGQWGAKVVGKLELPEHSGAVFVCNHRCSVDPLFVQLVTRRIVHWMVAREYVEHPMLRWLFRATQSIAVNRGGIDTAAMKRSIRYLQDGELVGIFPEGKLNTTDQLLLPGRPGAAALALKGKVPIVPFYIHNAPEGSSVYAPLWKFSKTTVSVGSPIDLSAYYGREREPGVLEEITRRLMIEIAKLADQPDFQPQLGHFRGPRRNEVDSLPPNDDTAAKP